MYDGKFSDWVCWYFLQKSDNLFFNSDREQSDAERKDLLVLCVYVLSAVAQSSLTAW